MVMVGIAAEGADSLLLVIPDATKLLLVLHDFESRSPDELTLRKGEQVELLETDGRRWRRRCVVVKTIS